MIGISKQAVSQYSKREAQFNKQLSGLLIQVDELRSEHPGCGVQKMYETLEPDFLGRDKFVEIFMSLGYRVKHKKNYIRTTIPTHLKYPNLIEGLCVYKPNQLWQSDITYFHLNGRFYYLVFIIDVYTRKIVGYQVSDHLRAEANISALKGAIRSKKCSLEGMIHHSDRGSQYVDKKYLALLKKHNIKVSMGLKAQDNAYAERINGTIKNDYLKHWDIKSFKNLQLKVRKAVNHYNTKRKHDSLPNGTTPVQFEKTLVNLDRHKKPVEIIFAEGKKKNEKKVDLPAIKLEQSTPVYICPL
jgi:hypothetical protein